MAIGHTVCEGIGWHWELEDELRMSFTGTSIEIAPAVLMRVTFDDGDAYKYHKVHTAWHFAQCTGHSTDVERTSVVFLTVAMQIDQVCFEEAVYKVPFHPCLRLLQLHDRRLLSKLTTDGSMVSHTDTTHTHTHTTPCLVCAGQGV